MFPNSLYYQLKPLIPRWLQIQIRRQIVRRKREKYSHIWPIDERAAKPPEGWTGWPDGKKFALVLTHDVESAKGVERCLELAKLEERLGFRSSFNFVAEDYHVPRELFDYLKNKGFEIGVHGINHSENVFKSYRHFQKQAPKNNEYLKKWGAVGFRAPSMYHNLNWVGELNIEYDSSTFDTDPFEPQPDGVGTIFPFWVAATRNPQHSALNTQHSPSGYIELPYTLPQDHTLFVVMGEKDINIWKKKLDWIADRGGMALLITHPDYMDFVGENPAFQKYPSAFYVELLEYIKNKYEGKYWNVIPKEMATFSRKNNLLINTRFQKLTINNFPISNCKKIWIDLDNSPHVPFFMPIMRELKSKGYELLLTTRDCSQTCGMADLFCLQYHRIGKHYGKKKLMKVYGTILRAIQLANAVRNKGIKLAVSHGSRAQMLASHLLGIPSVAIMDYEYTKGFVKPDWVIMPEIIPVGFIRIDSDHIFTYPGIKEDVYVPEFVPTSNLRRDLELNEKDILVTIRPPATEAHYHNPESEVLFNAVIDYLAEQPKVKMVLLPRYDRQQEIIFQKWERLIREKKIIVPDKVVNGLDLIWHSDLVVSGGGTMNREAAALGVPVYSIFRGKIGAVDRYLSQKGRLTLLEDVADIPKKIQLFKRNRELKVDRSKGTLNAIVSHILKLLET